MVQENRRHDISDRMWELLEPHLPGRRGAWGRVAVDNRRFINAVIWILRTGAPCRDLPPEYGDWKNTHRRFCRWRDKGIWEKLFNLMGPEPEEAIRTWGVQKGAKLKNPPCCRRAWNAS